IYALGVVMYEALAGRVPFESDTYMGVLTKHLFETPDPIERVAPDPSRLGALAAIIMRCLAKVPLARFRTMDELADAIEDALRGPGGSAKRTATTGDGTGARPHDQSDEALRADPPVLRLASRAMTILHGEPGPDRLPWERIQHADGENPTPDP